MKPLQVYLPEAFIKHLKQKALNDGCSVSDLVRDALGADNDVLLTNKVVVPKMIKEPVKQPQTPLEIINNNDMSDLDLPFKPGDKITGADANKMIAEAPVSITLKQPEKPKNIKVNDDGTISPIDPKKPSSFSTEVPAPKKEPFKFPPSAASQLDVIKTPEQAKKAVESPKFIDKSYSARKKGSKERHVEL